MGKNFQEPLREPVLVDAFFFFFFAHFLDTKLDLWRMCFSSLQAGLHARAQVDHKVQLAPGCNGRCLANHSFTFWPITLSHRQVIGRQGLRAPLRQEL